MKKLLTYGTIILALLASKPSFAQKGLSATYLKDTRNYHGVMFSGFSNELPFGLKVNGFIDVDSKANSTDLSTFYTEPRISKTGFFKKKDNLVDLVLNGIGFIAEYNGSNKENDDKIRAGIISNNNIKGLTVNFKYLPLNTKKGQQLSVFLKKSGKDWYVNGFMDYNIINGKNKIVSELWGGHKIKDKFYAVLEARLNQFLKENSKGIGIGLEYMF